MGKHTPGPWVWTGKPGASDLRAPSTGLSESDSDSSVISYAPYEGMWLSRYGSPAEDEANARLIAAAPCLLEALQDALAYLQNHLPDEALAPHRAAIAKATGDA